MSYKKVQKDNLAIGKIMQGHNEKFNKQIEIIKKNKIEILELNIAINKIKMQ